MMPYPTCGYCAEGVGSERAVYEDEQIVLDVCVPCAEYISEEEGWFWEQGGGDA